MIANGPDKKGCRKQCDKKQRHNVSSDWHVADDEKTDEQNTERHERVDVKERHRGVNRELEPERQRARLSILFRASEEFFAPVVKQDQACGNCVEKTALSPQHREGN